jgi:polyvinyl alcohol dehydrogenase (cytochrome)
LLLAPAFLNAATSGVEIYQKRCAACHEAPDSRAPSPEALRKMSAARILHTIDFGVMMSVTYMLTREEREAVASYLGTVTDNRAPLPQAFCSDRTVKIDRHLKSEWNGWGPLPTNTRYNASAALSIDQVKHLKLKWAFGFEGDVNAFAQPAVLANQLFVGSASGLIHALDVRSGCSQWEFQADGPVRTAMVVAPLNERVKTHALLFGDQIGWFYAVEAETGKLLWKKKPEAHEATKLTGTPVVYQGTVYVPVASWEESRPLNPSYQCCTFRGSIVALRVADGSQVWKSYTVLEEPKQIGKTKEGVPQWGPSGAGVWSAPALDVKRKLLYVATGDNYSEPPTDTSDAILAMDLATGKIAWSRQVTADDINNLYCSPRGNCPGQDFDFGSPAILERLPNGRDVVLAGQKSGLVFALDPDKKGEIVWQARVGKGGTNGGVMWGMASDGQNVYASVSDLGRIRGAKRDPLDPRPAAVDPKQGGGLTALRIGDGGKVWFAPPADCGSRPNCSPAQPSAVSAIPGVVFSGDVGGTLRAFAAEDGRVLWDFDTAREFTTVNGVHANGGAIDGSGAIAVGGMVLVNSGYARNGGMPGNVLLVFAPEN